MRIIPSILVALVALALAGDAAAQPPLHRAPHTPDLVLTVESYGTVSFDRVCDGNRPTDHHVYNLAGRPYRQGHGRYGTYWYRPGHAHDGRHTVAGFDPANAALYSFTRRAVLYAVWC